MVDVNDDAKAGFRRIDVLTGPSRRRRWSPEEKVRISQRHWSRVRGCRRLRGAGRFALNSVCIAPSFHCLLPLDVEGVALLAQEMLDPAAFVEMHVDIS